MGNGFSRMLQMLNVDIRKTGHNDSDNEDFRRSQIVGNGNGNGILPKIDREHRVKAKSKEKGEANLSMENPCDPDDSFRPKIVKIYKKKNA